MLKKDLHFLFRSYWFYILILVFTLIFNYKFYLLFLEYSNIFSDYSISLREKLYIPFSSSNYIFSNISDFYSYTLIFFVNIINSKISQERDNAIDKFEMFFYSKTDASFLNSKLIFNFIGSGIVALVPYFLLITIYPFYRFELSYLLKLFLAQLLLVLFMSSATMFFYLFNIKYYFSLFLGFIFSAAFYYLVLSKQFMVFYRGGINLKLILLCFIFYFIMFFINLKIIRFNRLT